MGKISTNSLGKSAKLKLHWFCLYNAYSMPKDIYSVVISEFSQQDQKQIKIKLDNFTYILKMNFTLEDVKEIQIFELHT